MNKPYMTKRHLVLEILSYVLLLVCFIIAIVGMATLPDEIPTHFTMSGEIDGYGSPGTLLILPIIMLICNGMTSLIMHVMPPTMWNTPSKLKPQNAVRALQDMISMIAWMELEISVFTPVSHDQHLPWKRCGLGFYYSICGRADSDDHLLYSCIPEA